LQFTFKRLCDCWKSAKVVLGRVLINPAQCSLRSESDRKAVLLRNDAKAHQRRFERALATSPVHPVADLSRTLTDLDNGNPNKKAIVKTNVRSMIPPWACGQVQRLTIPHLVAYCVSLIVPPDELCFLV
jgi:hypothetical protein